MRWIQLCTKPAMALTILLFGLTLLGQESTESPEDQKERLTVERFLQVLEKKPKDGTALERVYAWYADRGAIEELCHSLHTRQVEKADGSAALLLGLLQTRRGQDTEAQRTFEAAEKLLPNEPLPSYYLGKCLLLQGQIDLATAALQRAVDKNPGKAETLEILKELGRTFQRAKRPTDAIDVWKKLESLFPGDLQVQEQIAAVMTEEGAEAEALPRYQALSAATKDRFRQIEFAMQAASLKLKLNQTDEALKDFEALLARLNPDSWLYQEINQRIERHYLARNNTPGLSAYLTQWIDKHPQDIEAMLRLGRILSINKQSAEAAAWFNKVIELAPTREDAYLELSQAMQRDGQLATAAATMEKLCGQVTDNVDHIVRWGELVLADTSQPVEARQAKAAEIWRKLLANHDKDQVMLARVAELMRGASRTDEALELYRRAISVDPAQLQYYEYLADYLFKLNRRDEAQKVWDEMASGPRETVDNLFRKAEVLAQFGLESQALDSLAKACQMRPTLSQRLRYIDKLINTSRFDTAFAEIAVAYQQATAADQQSLVLEREVQAFLASGQLPKKTLELEAVVNAPGATVTADQWKKYAIYLNTGSQYQLATLAIEKAIALDSQSPQLHATAAGIYERAGYLSKAIETLRKLVEFDRRQQISLLMQIAELQSRLGNEQAAYATAKELVAAPGAGVEHVRFFADLCFRVNKPEEGLAALRKNLRNNPSDRTAMSALAQRLATLFKTDEAIEVTWRSLAKANSLEERRQDVQMLASYYQRIGNLKKLIARLEEYGRQNNRVREATLLKAYVWQSTEDYGMARRLLDDLNIDNTDADLLRTLVNLAQAEGDFDSAARYQAAINKLEPTPDGRMQLARYLFASDDPQASNKAWEELKANELTLEQLQSSLQLVIASNNKLRAQQLVKGVFDNSPDDWQKLAVCAVAMSLLGCEEEMVRACDHLKRLRLPPETPATLATGSSSSGPKAAASASNMMPFTNSQQMLIQYMAGGMVSGRISRSSIQGWPRYVLASGNSTSTKPLACMARTIALLNSIQSAQLSTMNGMTSPTLSNLTNRIVCFEDARLTAESLRYLRSQESGELQFVSLPVPTKTDIANEQNIDKLWHQLFLTSLSNPIGDRIVLNRSGNGPPQVLVIPNGPNGQFVSSGSAPEFNEARWQILQRLVELQQPEAPLLLLIEDQVQLQNGRLANFQSEFTPIETPAQATLQVFAVESLERMARLFHSAPQLVQSEELALSLISHGIILESELRAHARPDNKLPATIKALALKCPSFEGASDLQYNPPDACEVAIEASRRQLRGALGSPNLQLAYMDSAITSFAAQFTQAKNMDQVKRLLTGLKQVQAEHARSLTAAQLLSFNSNQRISFVVQNGSRHQVIEMAFPPPSALLSSDLMIALYYCQLHFTTQQAAEIEQLLVSDVNSQASEPAQKAVDLLALMTWKWWQGDRTSEQECLKLAKDLKAVSPSFELAAFLESSLQSVSGHHDAALAVLDEIKNNDPQVQVIRQQAIFDLHANHGSSDKAREAAQQLLKLPLPASTQLELLAYLDRLGVRPESPDVLKRIQLSGGNSLETQLTLMQEFLKQNNHESAREVARDILRATRGTLQSRLATMSIPAGANASSSISNRRDEESVARKQALLVLANSPEIADQISDLELRLKQSPKSKSVINELSELYEATGKNREAQELKERIRTPASNSTARNRARIGGNALSQANPLEILRRDLTRISRDPNLLNLNADSFIRKVNTLRGWDALSSDLAKLDYTLFPDKHEGLQKLLRAAAKGVQLVSSNKIITKLIDDDRVEYAGIFISHAGEKPKALPDEVIKRCLDRILADIDKRSLTEIFPLEPPEAGLLRGPLCVLHHLTNDERQAQRVLEAAAPLSGSRPDLKALQILMLLELGRPKDALVHVQQLAERADVSTDCLWELASELEFEYQQHAMAIAILERITENDIRSSTMQESSPKQLLLACYENSRDYVKAKKILDESLVNELAKLGAKSDSDVRQAAEESLGNLAVHYHTCGYAWDALIATIKARSLRKSDSLFRNSAFPTAQQNTPLPLERYETSFESSLSAAQIINGIGREAEPENRDHPLAIPLEMLTPAFSTNEFATDKLNSRLTEKFWWVKQDQGSSQLSQPVFELAEKNADRLSLPSLIALFCLAEKLDASREALVIVEALRKKLNTLPAPGDTDSGVDGRLLRSALWVVAHRLVAHHRLDLVRDFASAAAELDDNQNLYGLQAQLCVAHAMIVHQQLPEAQACLRDILNKASSSPRAAPVRRLLLTFRAAELAIKCDNHQLSLDAFTQAFESGAMQQLILNRDSEELVGMPASNPLATGFVSVGNDGTQDHRKPIFDIVFAVLNQWQQRQVDASQVVDALIKCVLPNDPGTEIRLLADTNSQADSSPGPVRTTRAANVIRSQQSSQPYNARTAEAIQKFKDPQTNRYLAFALVEWASRCGRLDQVIAQIEQRLAAEPQPDGQLLLLYALRVAGQKERVVKDLETLVSTDAILNDNLELLLQSALSDSPIVSTVALPDSAVDGVLYQAMTNNLSLAAPYCQQRILKAIADDDIEHLLKLTNLFTVCCRDINRTAPGSAKTHHEFLFLNEVCSHCSKAGRDYMAIAFLARLQELSRNDKGDARYRHGNRAKDALLSMCRLPEAKRYALAKALMLNQPRLTVDSMNIYYLPSSGLPNWALSQEQQSAWASLRPHANSSTISLLDVLLSGAEQRGQLNEVLSKLNEIATDTPQTLDRSRPSSRLIQGPPGQAAGMEIVESPQTAKRLLYQWLRLRADMQGVPLADAARTIEQELLSEYNYIGWLKYLPEAAQSEVFEFHRQKQELPEELTENLKSSLGEHFMTLRNCMPQTVQQYLSRRAGFVPAQSLRHWLETDGLAGSDGQQPNRITNWMIMHSEGHLVAPYNRRCLLLNIPLEGDVSLSLTAAVQQPTPKNSFGCLLNGLGVEYRDRTNLAVRDAPVKITNWLSSGRECDLVVRRLEKPDETAKARKIKLERRAGKIEIFVDEIQVGQSNFSSMSFPFLGLMPSGHEVTLRDVKVTGTPIQQVQLLDESLNGWNAQRYKARVPSTTDVLQEPGIALPQIEFKPQDADWFFRNNELQHQIEIADISASKQTALNATHSYLGYARPMQPGDRLEYEVYCDAVYELPWPSIGFEAMVIEEDQVKLHWLPSESDLFICSDLLTSRGQGAGAEQLSTPQVLLGSWNKVVLRMDENDLTLSLNGKDVYRRPLGSVASREFGWICNPAVSRVRIRHATLQGKWPATVPADLWER